MNTDQIKLLLKKNWLKIIFIASISIFFLSAVKWVDTFALQWKNKGAWSTIGSLGYFDLAIKVLVALQYLAIICFIIYTIYFFTNKQNIWSFASLFIYGILTVFFLFFGSVTRYVSLIPLTGAGEESLVDQVGKLTVYISAFSGFIAAITGLLNQITTGRKAMAEIELENYACKPN